MQRFFKDLTEIETEIPNSGRLSTKASELVPPDRRSYLSGGTGINIEGEAIHKAVNQDGYSTQSFIKKQVEEAKQRLGKKPDRWGIWNVDKDGDLFSELDPTSFRVGKRKFTGRELLRFAERKNLEAINFHGFFNIYLDWCAHNGFQPGLFPSDFKSKLKQLNQIPQEIIDNGGVYLISDGRYTKVGYCSSSPFKRLGEIQVGNPEPLFVAGVMPGDKDNEEFCRNKLKKAGFTKKNGEWLKGNPARMIKVLDSQGFKVYSNVENN
jgi:hypothetical protein